MANIMCHKASSGGGAISTSVTHDTMRRTAGVMKSYTIDASKSYVLTICFRYNGDSTNIYRSVAYSVVNGVLTDLTNTAATTGCSATLTDSGTTLNVIGDSAASYWHDITLVQLN